MAQSESLCRLTGIGVICPDLEKSMDFYLNVIGMTRTGGFDIDAGFAKASGLTSGSPFHVEVLRTDDSPDGVSWKLLSFGNASAPKRSEHVPDEAGMQYITLHVNRLAPFLHRFREHGIRLPGESPVAMGGNEHFILVRAPEGTFIELIGPLE
jgi:catechol 2,3-dioxygenase-like lactoylglutathione lyase family enzyme